MKPINDNLYLKIRQLSDTVQDRFRQRGIAIPVENSDGTVSIGSYTIGKNDRGYIIVNRHNEIEVDGINLPQTAALVANGLALGRFKDQSILNTDRSYGFALFEEDLYKRAVSRSCKRDLEYFYINHTKFMIAKAKRINHKRSIANSFEKLRNLA